MTTTTMKKSKAKATTRPNAKVVSRGNFVAEFAKEVGVSEASAQAFARIHANKKLSLASAYQAFLGQSNKTVSK